MIGVVICTHARLGGALLEAAKMILGELDQAEAVSVEAGHSGEDILDRIGQAMAAVDSGDGVIILCDMFGGTPSNVSLTLMGASTEIVTGVNLPMLLKLFTSRDKPLQELANTIQQHGRDNILVAGALLGGREVNQ
ncbi:MAG: PTS sugar transporter subunit IIA [Myxococcota bacterium]|nr:PTS sugar transporter subunit IIA [Myxococcota bacterium]